jgi:hypothetical protein
MSHNHAFSQIDDKKDDVMNLQESLHKLSFTSLPSEYGLSSIFHSHVSREQAALKQCEQAMDLLANEYIARLINLQNTQDPDEALLELSAAEFIWEEQTAIIKQNTQDEAEINFLVEMRKYSMEFLERHLIEVADLCSKNVSPSHISLCLGIIDTLSRIYDELDEDYASQHKQRLERIKNKFRLSV